ncbi:MAG: class I SAM-dependent methyltransferase [Pseudomonadales bacterium]
MSKHITPENYTGGFEGHPMLPQTDHDEHAQQAFVLSLKQLVNGELLAGTRQLCERKAREELGLDSTPAPEARHAVRKMMAGTSSYRIWSSLLRNSQELLWDYVGESVDRQLDELNTRANSIETPLGSLRLNPDFMLPGYLAAVDQHIMPGGYGDNPADDDVRSGAVYDRGAALYHMGQVNLLNDVRGHTLAAYLQDVYGELKPLRILDMGCTVGHSTLVLCDYFPDAEIHAIDVGPSQLRYAHARAEHLGKTVHFSQQSAESTDFESGSFDLVVSSAMFHETSTAAVPQIMRECMRLLRPGGICAHAEVPVRYDRMPVADVLIRDWQTYHNGEPFWGGCATTDFGAALEDASFVDVQTGFQPATRDATDPTRGHFSSEGDASFRYWYLFGGKKPSDA